MLNNNKNNYKNYLLISKIKPKKPKKSKNINVFFLSKKIKNSKKYFGFSKMDIFFVRFSKAHLVS